MVTEFPLPNRRRLPRLTDLAWTLRNPLNAADARGRLSADAQNFLRQLVTAPPPLPRLSVVDKTRCASSGDPHDYCSLARYWWPNPEVPGGEPWIRRDGYTNPLTEDPAHTDRMRIDWLAEQIRVGIMAWLYLGDRQAAERTAQAILTWFIHPDTRMNPHLRFAQAIPGISAGRGLGIIDTRYFIGMWEAAECLFADGIISGTDFSALRTWAGDLATWMATSDLGEEEASQDNNHGSWYDAQVLAFARFAGLDTLARKIAVQVPERRFARQIACDGHQPHEATRTLSWDYHGLNAAAFLTCADEAEYLGIDLWSDARLRQACSFLARFDAAAPQLWPWQQMKPPGGLDGNAAVAMAACAWPEIAALRTHAERWLSADSAWFARLRYPLWWRSGSAG